MIDWCLDRLVGLLQIDSAGKPTPDRTAHHQCGSVTVTLIGTLTLLMGIVVILAVITSRVLRRSEFTYMPVDLSHLLLVPRTRACCQTFQRA